MPKKITAKAKEINIKAKKAPTTTPDKTKTKDQLLKMLAKMQLAHDSTHKALKASDDKYKELINDTDDLVTQVDSNGRFTMVNHKSIGIFGLKPEECVGKSAFSFIHPEDRERTRQWFDELLRNKSNMGRIENRQVSTDGTVSHMFWTSSVHYDDDGNVSHVNAIANDITVVKRIEGSLQEKEAFIQAVLDNLPIGIAVNSVDPIVDFNYMNDNFPRFYRTSRDELAKSDGFWDAVYEDPIFREEIKKTVLDDCASGDTERMYWVDVPITRKGQETTFITARNTPTPDNKLMISTVWDVTERKKAEETLRTREADVIKAQKLEALGVLAGGIAHDFNNMLTSIFGNVSLAKLAAGAGTTVHERLNDIEKTLIRTKLLTHQLLTFSKGGSPARKSQNISSLIRDIVQFSLSGTNVQSSVSIANDLSNVDVDEGQISQVIQNLVINANDAMPEGGKLTVRAENTKMSDGDMPQLSAGNYVVVYIRDTGHGIAKEHLAKIFDPFFTTKDSGSGLGLSSSYSIIKQHNGALAVYSEAGQGTVFRIYLPVAERVDEARAKETSTLSGHGKVLIMDDEECIRVTNQALLEALGYSVEVSSNGEEAMEKFIEAHESGKTFDAVILDLTIKGGMGGEKTLEKLLKIEPNVKAIVTSGYAEGETLSNFRKYGFKAKLLKPYNIEHLSQVLQEVINS